jgi:hypothetical protein
MVPSSSGGFVFSINMLMIKSFYNNIIYFFMNNYILIVLVCKEFKIVSTDLGAIGPLLFSYPPLVRFNKGPLRTGKFAIHIIKVKT